MTLEQCKSWEQRSDTASHGETNVWFPPTNNISAQLARHDLCCSHSLSHRRSALAIYLCFSFSKSHIVKNPHETTVKAAKLPSASLCRQWFTSQSFFSDRVRLLSHLNMKWPKRFFLPLPPDLGFCGPKRETLLSDRALH